MSKEIYITEAGSIVSQEKNKVSGERVAADKTYNLLSIEIGTSEPKGEGYVTVVMIGDDMSRIAYLLPNEALPDVASLINGFLEVQQGYKDSAG